MTFALIFYNSFLFALTIIFLVVLNRTEEQRRGERLFLLIIAQGCIVFLSSILFPVDGFARIQLLAWGVFLHLPVFFIAASFILRKKYWVLRLLLVFVTIVIGMIAIDAFLIEPQWLEVSAYSLKSSKLNQPLKIVLLADIQTDQPGTYEAEVFALTAAEEPDLVLFAGDYLQIFDSSEYNAQLDEFNSILKLSHLDPPLGMYAVRGNVDHENWELLFNGLDVDTFQSTNSLDLGPISLTGISWRDSEDTGLSVGETDLYHIVLGHSPNYSLGNIRGDLLLAGHTHGGQFQIPGFGPILTLSAVPRNWASGLTEISPGQYLLVSRGIGLERGNSPRMRFFCRPQLVVINLSPTE